MMSLVKRSRIKTLKDSSWAAAAAEWGVEALAEDAPTSGDVLLKCNIRMMDSAWLFVWVR